MSSPDPRILYLSETRKARHAMLHPRSNHDPESRFVDPHANGFQMPPHFDQYNPETWPEAYVKHRVVHTSSQQPKPNQSYGDALAHALDQAHHGGREVIPPVHGRGNESSTSVRNRPPVSQPYSKAELSKGSRAAREDEVDKGFVNLIGLPNRYVLVPQTVFVGPVGSIISSIEFKPRTYDEPGISVNGERATHRIDNSTDKVFSQVQGIDNILIWIQWPGYLRHPYEGTICNVRNFTRRELLDRVCGMVILFVRALKARHVVVDKELAKWMIGQKGLKLDWLFVARLHHRGGNYFQPEILLPLPREK